MRNSKLNSENIKETSRLEAFSDGVFSIAITLLILELIEILHQQADDTLLKILINHLDAFLAFFIGFLTILICWINHHIVIAHVKKTDSNLMWVNGFVLLVVTFTPFPTAILAEYFKTDSHTAVAIFGFNYVMMSLAAYSITAYVYNKHLIDEDYREEFYGFKLMYKYSIAYTALIFFICFISVVAAIIFYCILFIVFAYPREFSARLLKLKHRKHKAVTTTHE
jgi:uncharacterized membrane protein